MNLRNSKNHQDIFSDGRLDDLIDISSYQGKNKDSSSLVLVIIKTVESQDLCLAYFHLDPSSNIFKSIAKNVLTMGLVFFFFFFWCSLRHVPSMVVFLQHIVIELFEQSFSSN